MGMLYLRGKTWWVQYYENGKKIRESAKTQKKMVAKKLLEQREGDIAKGKTPGFYFDKVTYDQLADAMVRDYELNGVKSLQQLKRNRRIHLDPFFSGLPAIKITSAKVQQYIDHRKSEGSENATVNRELSAIKRMFSLGERQTPPMVDKAPYIAMLKENNARKGFFEYEEFVKLRDAFPAYLRGLVTFAYKVGWRYSEITGLTWGQVDRQQWIVRLEVGETKNKAGRTVYLDSELQEVFKAQWQQRRNNGILTPCVFPKQDGGKLGALNRQWQEACKKAGLTGKIFHDFRRTAVRDMVRSGIPERVAMMISGHKSRCVFERYNIVNDIDLRQAAQRRENYRSDCVQNVPNNIEQFQTKANEI